MVTVPRVNQDISAVMVSAISVIISVMMIVPVPVIASVISSITPAVPVLITRVAPVAVIIGVCGSGRRGESQAKGRTGG